MQVVAAEAVNIGGPLNSSNGAGGWSGSTLQQAASASDASAGPPGHTLHANPIMVPQPRPLSKVALAMDTSVGLCSYQSDASDLASCSAFASVQQAKV